jgi:uncharacterized repeat protein (TIGR03833 family)
MAHQVGIRYPEPGDKVKVVQKKDYLPGKLTEGVVKDVLTKKAVHPRGHKVRLTSGIIGRVQEFSGGNSQLERNISYKPSEDDLV